MYYIGRKIENEEITRPNTFILYFTAYLIHYFYNSKTKGDRKRKDFRFGSSIEKYIRIFFLMLFKGTVALFFFN